MGADIVIPIGTVAIHESAAETLAASAAGRDGRIGRPIDAEPRLCGSALRLHNLLIAYAHSGHFGLLPR